MDNSEDFPDQPLDVAIVAVTYKRPELLKVLLDSILELKTAPSRVVIVDNASHDETPQVVESYREKLGKHPNGTDRLVYAPQETNSGGAGGFSIGTKIAYDLGVEWLWLMDDDVAVEPDALELLKPWMTRFEVIQGRRHNFDGRPFYWQFEFNTRLGIPNPIAKDTFDEKNYLTMNTVCFEGGLFHRNIVAKLGLPDPRFFIYWDDTVYGYLASKVTEPVLVNEFIMRRTRTIKQWDMGPRRLNSTSNMVRYHIMRNRGYMARYFGLYDDFHPVAFSAGTALTLVKEMIRLVAVDRSFKEGIPALIRGMLDAHKVYNDTSWQPMPPLAPKNGGDSNLSTEK